MKFLKGCLRALVLATLAVGSVAADCTESQGLLPMEAQFSLGGLVADSTNKWGYGYDSLLKDLEEWKQNPYVKIDSIGATVQKRALWMVTITDDSDSLGTAGDPGSRKRRIFVHARTHPSEVQAEYIANEMIAFLLDSTEVARAIRKDFIFHIIPMYNPDGVEEGFGRLNGNGVNLEVNWNKVPVEPEVEVLRHKFSELMAGANPVQVALNLHSDQFWCTRFFFYHVAFGTSFAYTELEQDFIGKVRSHFNPGIKNWDFVQSWADTQGLKFQYPEGFWWSNYQEKVMALTYEDANCPGASHFDSTARALVLGATEYARTRPVVHIAKTTLPRIQPVFHREPRGLLIFDTEGRAWERWLLTDLSGRKLASGRFENGEALVPALALESRFGSLILYSRDGKSMGRSVAPSMLP